jgi:hypothetical protein
MAQSIPSEFDVDFEARRARLVRRRFLWMCGARIALALIGAITFLAFLRVGSEFGPADRVRAAASLFNLLVFAVAGAYAWRTPPHSRGLLRAVFWLVVLTGAANLVAARLAVGFDHDLSGDPATAYLRDALGAILINHFAAALFIRWSVREALAPAAALLAINLVMTATFLPHHVPGVFALALLVLSPLCIVPGLVVCWWRYSRLRETFRIQFESGQYRQLQAELTSARRLHESLLPPQQHDGPVRLSYVYEPMRQIGGDLIYLHRENDSCLSVVVLDVTGHGIPAALTVNRMIGELDRLFAETPDISASQVIRSLNRYVSLTLSRHGIFVTAFCAKVDCDGESLEWCNGGHPPAFVRRRGGQLEPLGSTAPLLGLDNHQAYAPEDELTRFEPGDALVCYTDGAAEAMDPDHRMVGIAGVERLLAQCAAEGSPPPEWPAAILRGVFDHRQAPPADDTLIAVIYRPINVPTHSARPIEQRVPQPV